MEAEIRGGLRLVAWSAAFGVALHLGSRHLATAAQRRRLLAGLVLGAVAARGGFFALHAEVLAAHPHLHLDPAAGYSVLFVPLGLLLVAPWRRGGAALHAYLQGALSCLPLALAVARLGCFAAGCCPGLPTDRAWGLRWAPAASSLHPVALYEVAGLCGLAASLERVPQRLRPGLALAGVGALRGIVEAWRAPSPLGVPLVSAHWIAGAWVVLGLVLATCVARPSPSPRVPGSLRT